MFAESLFDFWAQPITSRAQSIRAMFNLSRLWTRQNGFFRWILKNSMRCFPKWLSSRLQIVSSLIPHIEDRASEITNQILKNLKRNNFCYGFWAWNGFWNWSNIRLSVSSGHPVSEIIFLGSSCVFSANSRKWIFCNNGISVTIFGKSARFAENS